MERKICRWFDLNRDVEEKRGGKGKGREREAFRRKKPERCWANWLPAVFVFFIYAETIMKAQLPWVFSLFQYCTWF